MILKGNSESSKWKSETINILSVTNNWSFVAELRKEYITLTFTGNPEILIDKFEIFYIFHAPDFAPDYLHRVPTNALVALMPEKFLRLSQNSNGARGFRIYHILTFERHNIFCRFRNNDYEK